MDDHIKIYSATDQNVVDLARIMRSNIEIYDAIMPGAFQRYAMHLEACGIPSTYKVEMIECDGDVVGFMGTIEIDDDRVYLLALYLMKEHQKKGLGRVIVDKMIRSYQLDNRKEIVLLAHKDATWACRFYEKNGFKLVSRDEKEIKRYSNGIMEKHYIRNSVLYSLKIGE